MVPKLSVTYIPEYVKDPTNSLLISTLQKDFKSLEKITQQVHYEKALTLVLKKTAQLMDDVKNENKLPDSELYPPFVKYLNSVNELLPNTSSYLVSTLINNEVTKLVGSSQEIDRKLAFYRLAEILHIASDLDGKLTNNYIPQPKRKDILLFCTALIEKIEKVKEALLI